MLTLLDVEHPIVQVSDELVKGGRTEEGCDGITVNTRKQVAQSFGSGDTCFVLFFVEVLVEATVDFVNDDDLVGVVILEIFRCHTLHKVKIFVGDDLVSNFIGLTDQLFGGEKDATFVVFIRKEFSHKEFHVGLASASRGLQGGVSFLEQ